jgi:hypothetical protein
VATKFAHPKKGTDSKQAIKCYELMKKNGDCEACFQTIARRKRYLIEARSGDILFAPGIARGKTSSDEKAP